MSIKIIREKDHGRTTLDWLDGRHGFSFNEYYNENNMNFGKLIVFNDDIIEAGKGFGSHHHDNAEVFTFVIEGALEHKDSTGNQGVINEYEIQRMSAGSGIVHSEFNHSKERRAHILQIWLLPRKHDSKPNYEQRSFKDLKDKKGVFKLISGEKSEDLIYIDQDAEFYIAYLDKEEKKVDIKKGFGLYLYVLEGEVKVNGELSKKGDALEIKDESSININSAEESRFVMIQTAM